MPDKQFLLAPDAIKPLVNDAGACLATDRITVEGKPVGFMYRDVPDDKLDSGWRFMAGDEDDTYMDVAENQGVYDVNTVANYDSDIVPLLTSPVGAAFVRNESTGEFEATESPLDPDDCLHPDYPIVEGDYGLSDAWQVSLSAKFNRRVEDGALVLWRPGLTLYFIAWNNDHNDDIETRLALLSDDLSPEAFDPRESEVGGLPHFSYRLREGETNVLYGFVVAEAGHLQVAISFDDVDDLDTGYALFESIGGR